MSKEDSNSQLAEILDKMETIAAELHYRAADCKDHRIEQHALRQSANQVQSFVNIMRTTNPSLPRPEVN